MAADRDSDLTLARLLDPAILANPYPFYRQLREADPVHWDIFMQAWVVTGYEDVSRVLRTFSAARTPTPDQLSEMGLAEMRIIAELTNNQMLFCDPPLHTRFRNLTASAFMPRSVAGLRDRVAKLVEQLLEAVEACAFDAVTDFAAVVPGIVTAAMLGVPEVDHSHLRQWANDFSETFGSFHYDPERTPVIVQSCRDMRDYFRDCIRRQRIAPTEGVLNALMTARVEGDKLTDEEVIANCIVIMVGGLETTTSLIANGLLTFLQLPAQLETVRRDPGLLPAAVEELLRYDSPVQHTGRIAPFEIELGGKQIRKGQPVIAVLAAANRDPARFPHPDSFDLSRADNRHLAFGWASHYCLGAPLARLEAQIAFAALLNLPNLRLNATRVAWRSHLGLRSVMSLPVRFDPRPC